MRRLSATCPGTPPAAPRACRVIVITAQERGRATCRLPATPSRSPTKWSWWTPAAPTTRPRSRAPPGARVVPHARLAGLRPAEEPRLDAGHRRLGVFDRRRRARHARAARRDPRPPSTQPARTATACRAFQLLRPVHEARSGWHPDSRRAPGAARHGPLHRRTGARPGSRKAPPAASQGDMLHESFRDLETVLEKLNRYSTAGAQRHGPKGVQGSLGRRWGTACGPSCAPTCSSAASWTGGWAWRWPFPTPRAPITATSSCGCCSASHADRRRDAALRHARRRQGARAGARDRLDRGRQGRRPGRRCAPTGSGSRRPTTRSRRSSCRPA